MQRNFYKQNGSYYYSDNSQKILNLSELQSAAKLGGKEISAPTISSSPIAPTNTISSDTVSGGMSAGGAVNGLPNTNATDLAIKSYTDRASQSGTQSLTDNQKQYDQLAAAQLQQTQANLKNEQSNLNQIQTDKTNLYNTQTQPLDTWQQFVSDTTLPKMDAYKNQYDQTYFENLFKSKKELSQSLIDYSKMMDAELNAPPSIGTGSTLANYISRQNEIKQNYVSKIAITESALKAIDGNITLSNDIINSAADTIQRLNNDRLQTLNVVEQLFGNQETDSRNKILTLTADEKAQITQVKADIQKQISSLEENKKFIQSLMTNKDLAPVIAKSGVLLTDTADQVAQKINAFYKANPNYGNGDFQVIKEKDAYGNEIVTGIFNNNTGEFVSSNGQEMRTDRNNNPTAMTTDVAKSLGLVEGVDYVQGDKFPDSNLYTAKLLGNPVETTIKALDTAAQDSKKQAFYTQGGKQRWTYIGMSDQQWLAMTSEQKRSTVAQMYKNEGGSGKLLNDVTFSDTAMSYAKEILSGRMKIENVPGEAMKNEVIRAKVELEKTDKPLADKLLAESLNDKITGLNDAISSKGMKGTVGAYALTRWTPFSPDKAERQNFIATVEQLISQETIDKLIQSKAAGATYGALSDGEREMLARAASKIGTWRIIDEDTKQVKGYAISEALMKKELETMKSLAQKAKDRILGDSVILPPGQLDDNSAYNEYLKIINQE